MIIIILRASITKLFLKAFASVCELNQPHYNMGKKRKAGAKPFGQSEEPVVNMKTKYGANETFDDSEDDFFHGRDKILLEERPEVKRRRRIEQDGM